MKNRLEVESRYVERNLETQELRILIVNVVKIDKIVFGVLIVPSLAHSLKGRAMATKVESKKASATAKKAGTAKSAAPKSSATPKVSAKKAPGVSRATRASKALDGSLLTLKVSKAKPSKKLPFNEETAQVLRDADAGKNLIRYSSFAEFVKDLDL